MFKDGISGIARGILARSFSPSEVCSASLQRIDEIQHLNAFITVTDERARLQARAADKRCQQGQPLPLEGVTIAVKDNFCTAGIRTTCASKMLEHFVPMYTATVVERLERAGALLLGKTNLDEFAMGAGATDSAFGPSKNPWRYGHDTEEGQGSGHGAAADFFITGGSSGGSAVAVATGSCVAALGSDTGGSVRNPGSRCGVAALKPTYGLLSRHGLIPLTHSLDAPGLMALKIADLNQLLAVCAGYDPLDSTSLHVPPDWLSQLTSAESQKSPCDLKVGIPQEYHCQGMQDEVVTLWEDVAELMSSRGAKVMPVSLPHTQYSLSCYSVINYCDVASNFACYDGLEYGHRAENMTSTATLFAESRFQGFSQSVRSRILCGNYFLLRENNRFFAQAARLRRLIQKDFIKAFNLVDLLLAPVTLTEATRYSEWVKKDNRTRTTLEDFCTQPANLAGVPALTLPCRLSSNGLPLGLQLIGPPLSEPKLLAVGKFLEDELKFRHECCQGR